MQMLLEKNQNVCNYYMKEEIYILAELFCFNTFTTTSTINYKGVKLTYLRVFLV